MSTVAKTLKLLNYLKSTTPELGLSQFTRLSGYDKASTHRRLTELVSAGFLEQDPATRAYRLGPALSRLALVREQAFPARESAQRVLQRLYERVHETVHVSVSQGTEGLNTLAHLDDQTHGNRVYIEPADMLPFHATASGVTVLAHSDQNFRDTVLGHRMAQITDQTETDTEVLRLLIEDARRSGFGRSEGAYEKDVYSIAAPIFENCGTCTAAIAIALPKARLTEGAEVQFMTALAEAADELSKHWGGEIPNIVREAWSNTLS